MKQASILFKLTFFFTFISLGADAQVFWTENFSTDNNCSNQGQFANTYVGTNGAWAVGSTGVNDPEANVWFVSSTEAGMGVPNCGDGCLNNPALNNQTLHIGANDGFVFDPGAAYDAGGLCGILVCVATHTRAESPTINCTGKVGITLAFNYMERGQAAIDDMDVWYFNGAVWALLTNPIKTATSCGGGQGKWTAFSIALPASANNNPLVKVGFNWKNNDDGVGTDPSTAIDDVTLSAPSSGAPVAAFSTPSTSICVGQCINFTDLSTNTPTTWAWTFTGATPNSSSIQNPTNICYNSVGTFAVALTVTNGNGSSTLTQNTYITVNALPTASAGSNVSICNGNSTTLNASGGTSYVWSPATGLSSTTIFNPVANPTVTTTYTVTVTNAAGCSATASVTVTVNALPNASAGNNVTICTGNNTSLTATGGTNYSWVPTSSLSNGTIANPTATPTATTTYTVYVTGANGCTDTAHVTVTVQSSLTANAGSPVSICQGGSTQLNASGGTNYAWLPTSGLSCTTCSNPIASPTITTTYTVTVSNGSCSSTASVVVTVNSLPTASAGSNVSICNGNSTTLNASGGTSYVWTPSTGLSSTTISNPVANPTATTTYTVTVTNAAGCSATASVTVTVNSLPTANAGNNVVICTGNNTSLTATGGTNYSWVPTSSLSNGTIANPTATPTITTTYTVYVTNAAGCTDTAQVTVTVQSSLTANAGSNVAICLGGNTQLNASGGSNYVWTPTTGLSSSTISNPVATPTITTTYTVTVSSGTCTSTASVTVTVNPNPTANSGSSSPICVGGSTTLSAIGGTGYVWTPSTGLSSSTVSNPTASPTITTTYTVTVSNAAGCTDTATTTVVVNPLPIVNAGNDVSICNGGNTILTATGGTTYLWAPSGSLNSSTGSSVTATPTTTTTYTITITDANGCSDTAQVTVIVTVCSGPIPIIQASATTICEGSCITFTDASTNSPVTWTWTFPNGTPASSFQQNPGSVCFSPAGTYTVSLTVGNGSGNNTITQVITVNPMPVAVAGTSTTISTGNSVTLSSSGGGTYSWAPSSSLSCVTCANPVATPTVTTTYTCYVTMGGCTDTAQVIIDVIDSSDIFIPNAFSPNGDGENDFFFVHGTGIKFIEIVVYDRIGEKMFETNDMSIGWDGTYKGQKMNTAVFVYCVTVYYFNGTGETLKGDLSLIR